MFHRSVLKKMFCVLSLLCGVTGVSLASGASVTEVSRLPVVSVETFQPGRSWTWNYWDGSEIYSSERYTVLSVQGSVVWIEMATRLAGQTEYYPHHRLKVSVDKCLQSYKTSGEPRPWSFSMYYRDGEQWVEMVMSKTLAFEEKFNCNPHRYAKASSYLTMFRDASEGRLFQQKRWGRIESSWFLLEGVEAGVAAEKDFRHEAGTSYLMKLQRIE